MASYHSGIFGRLPSINKCRSDPSLNEEWGCDAPKQLEVEVQGEGLKSVFWKIHPEAEYNDGKDVFLVCRHPLKVLEEQWHIDQWYDYYRWAIRTKSEPNIKEVHPVYKGYCDIYEPALEYFQSIVRSRR